MHAAHGCTSIGRTGVTAVCGVDTIDGQEADGVDGTLGRGIVHCRLGHLHGGSGADSHDLPCAHHACIALGLEGGLAGGHQPRLAKQSRLHCVVNRDRREFLGLVSDAAA